MFDAEKEKKLIKEFMSPLSAEKLGGETAADFEKRVKKEVDSILK